MSDPSVGGADLTDAGEVMPTSSAAPDEEQEQAGHAVVNETENTGVDDIANNDAVEEQAPAESGPGREEISIFSQDTADLPIAQPISLGPPAEEIEEQVREREQEQEEQNQAIQQAVPEDPEEAEKGRRRSKRQMVIMAVVALAALAGIVLGGVFGARASKLEPPLDPTPSPTSEAFASLQELVTSVSFDGGESLDDTDSPQYKALAWLADDANLFNLPDWKVIQRYVLGVFYYATNGDEWVDNTGWLSEEEECSWRWYAEGSGDSLQVCNEEGAYTGLVMEKNGINGTIPVELALLSNSLGKQKSLSLFCSYRRSERLTIVALISSIPPCSCHRVEIELFAWDDSF